MKRLMIMLVIMAIASIITIVDSTILYCNKLGSPFCYTYAENARNQPT